MDGTGIKIVIPAEKKWLEFMDRSLESALNIIKIDAPEQVSFAVREAFINAMRVSEELGKEKVLSIEMQLILSETCLEIRVLDEGKGLPSGWRETMSSKTCEEFIMGESGRGLCYINQYMNEMHSEFADDGRHVFSMRKNLGGEANE